MLFFSALTSATLLISTALAAAPPQIAAIQARVHAGQESNPVAQKFNNTFLVAERPSEFQYVPFFLPERLGAQFFTFNESSNPGFYTLQFQNEAFTRHNYLTLQTKVEAFASWQPTVFMSGPGNPRAEARGFYVNGTTVLWTNNFKKPARGDFGGWLLCKWWYEVPQLFFLTSYGRRATPSSNCVVADLVLIPIPNAS